MNLLRISDLSKEEQTDPLKKDLYNMVRQFVYKYQRHYHPHYKGDLIDLVSDFYIEFLTPKSRVKGKEESLLDKYNPEITSLPYLVKQSVIRKLIDRERTYKGEINYAEKYDEDTGDLSLDFLANKVDSSKNAEDIELTEEQIEQLKEKFNAMPTRTKNDFMKDYKEAMKVMSPYFQSIFKEIVGDYDTSSEHKEKSVKSLNNDSSIVESIKDKFPDITVNIQKVKAGDVIRVNGEDVSGVKEFMEGEGYKVYAKRGNNIYFIKS